MKNGKPATVVLALSGEFDLTSRDQVRAAFDAVSDAPRIVLDLSDTTYIDSVLVQELLRAHNARAAADLERETLVVRNRSFLRVFEILQLASVFRVVEHLDEAVGNNDDITVQFISAPGGTSGYEAFSDSRAV